MTRKEVKVTTESVHFIDRSVARLELNVRPCTVKIMIRQARSNATRCPPTPRHPNRSRRHYPAKTATGLRIQLCIVWRPGCVSFPVSDSSLRNTFAAANEHESTRKTHRTPQQFSAYHLFARQQLRIDLYDCGKTHSGDKVSQATPAANRQMHEPRGAGGQNSKHACHPETLGLNLVDFVQILCRGTSSLGSSIG